MRDLLFRDVRILDPGSGRDERGAVLVSRGRVVASGRDAGAGLVESEHLEVIEGRGRWLAPGFLDMHAHLREPGEEWKEDIASGLRAAAAGGFVDVCAMPNTKPVNDSRAITELMVARGRAAALSRLHPIAAITRGLGGKELTDVSELRDAGAIALSDDGKCVHHSAVMRRALQYARTFDVPIIQHAEDHDLTSGAEMHEGAVATRLGLRGWPREAEDIIVARDCILAEEARSRYHVAHLSTRGAARIVAEAKARGVRVSAEVTPHHLLLTHEAVVGYRTECKVNPPLREDEDVEALRKALADGTIDAIATDHAPHARADKMVEFGEARPGMIGLEICVPLLLGLVRDGALPLMRLLTALTLGPARVVGLPPNRLVDGARADLVLIDPDHRWTVSRQTLTGKSDNTPYLGKDVQGIVDMTLVEGRAVFARTSMSATGATGANEREAP